ncbi:zf-UBP-domain-containing protein [Rhodofomes roseus]|uniref:Zf-UBP-domain-containing protein n=1 Tax=Rhodofomes roseus TaxID=34475 RepID=A0ABQ8KPB2_9APHY|nr:zf-UBP-domain-containing protein [Rhodofomes roseus]KAH9840224.1 zf-UBP-domain-containing protein [Rhodofomes roseus]
MRNIRIRISLRSRSNIPTASTSYTSPSTASSCVVPSSIFQPLPSHKPGPTGRRHTVTERARNDDAALTDYRFGPIRIDWVDCAFETMSVAGSKKAGVGKEKATDARRKEPVVATFSPSASHSATSGSTNLPEGIVHIYRDVAGIEESGALTNDGASPGPEDSKDSAPKVVSDSQGLILAVLAVPAWMTPSDFLAFVAPATDGISLLRMIRDSAPNRSIVLLKFREASHASQFIESYNGKPFNSMEPETCHVVRVLSVTIDSDESLTESLMRENAQHSSDAVYELPTCPVCLERMDSAVTGLVTVPCSHTFHCACLSKWGDSRCPVCRYSQTLLSSHPPASSAASRPIAFSSSPPSAHCVECESTTNLWICLICGHIGCGRYGRAHAYGHYSRTTHLYALELETQRVWDYAGDGYVHRLIQNKADGKLVELPSASSAIGSQASRGVSGDRRGPSLEDALSAEKIEAIGIEYSYLLTSQLDSQRAFYEEQIVDLRGKVDELHTTVQRLTQERDEERERAQNNMTARKVEENAQIAKLQTELSKVHKKAERTADLVTQLHKELKEERAVSTGLLENLQKARREVDVAKQEKQLHSQRIHELEEQVRDIMFALEARSQIEQGQGVVAEAAGGSIAIGSHVKRDRSSSRK